MRSFIVALALVALVCAPAMAGTYNHAPAPLPAPALAPAPMLQAYEVPCPCPPPTVAYVAPQPQQYLVAAAPQPVCYTQQQTVCATPTVAAAPLTVENRLTWRERRKAGKDLQRSLRGVSTTVAVNTGAQVAYAQTPYCPPQAVGAYAEGAHAE